MRPKVPYFYYSDTTQQISFSGRNKTSSYKMCRCRFYVNVNYIHRIVEILMQNFVCLINNVTKWKEMMNCTNDRHGYAHPCFVVSPLFFVTMDTWVKSMRVHKRQPIGHMVYLQWLQQRVCACACDGWLVIFIHSQVWQSFRLLSVSLHIHWCNWVAVISGLFIPVLSTEHDLTIAENKSSAYSKHS